VEFTAWLWLVVVELAAAGVALHALLHKRDPRTAWGWIAVCLIVPALGPALYFLLGIDRIRTKARKLEARRGPRSPARHRAFEEAPFFFPQGPLPPRLMDLARLSRSATGRPLTAANAVDVLHDGEAAFPEMLAAIEAARHSVFLTTFIFETNGIGREFVAVLARAKTRGVDVRVVVDGIGELGSLPWAVSLLRKNGVPAERFLPPRLYPLTIGWNLRTHHKLLVVDGTVGFTGGMNIGDSYLGGADGRMTDLHFRLRGPVVAQMAEVFLWDWSFVSHTPLPPLPPPSAAAGGTYCRTFTDGPNEDEDILVQVLIGVLNTARERVWVMTPYFLPPAELVSAIVLALHRGVDVQFVIPERADVPVVAWAGRHMLGALIERGARISYRPRPFAHTKLCLADDHYVLIGSGNWDPRSLRLNFEFQVELIDKELNRGLAVHFAQVRRSCRVITTDELARRPLPERIRDAVCWLFSPYL